MLLAEFHQPRNGLIVKLERRLAGEWAAQVKSLVAMCSSPTRLITDLSEVTHGDSVGKELRTWPSGLHAKFIAETCYVWDLCERLHLTLEERRARRLAASRIDV